MTKKFILAIAALTLVGCAAQGPKHAIAVAPTCSSEADCTMKWAAARTWILAHAGYRMQTYSPDFMQTYPAAGGNVLLAAEVNRRPISGGGYVIEARFWCDNPFGCSPNQWDALDQFNQAVAAAR